MRPRVQVPTSSTKFSYRSWPTRRLVVDVTRHRSNLILALLCAAEFMLILDIEAHFRNEIVTGVGGQQIVLDDPSGNPVELFEPTIKEARLRSSS